MNQHQATEEVATAMYAAGVYDGVLIYTPTEPGNLVIFANKGATRLSVTVEILAQP